MSKLLSFLVDAIWQIRERDGVILMSDQMGLPITREQWQALRSGVDAFFATNPDEEIAKAHTEFHERYFSDNRYEVRPRREKKPKRERSGYIYLIYGIGTSWYKIGQSSNPQARLEALATKGPFRYELIKLHQVADMDLAERYWHDEFADKRANGEWFLLTDEDTNLFIEWQGEL